MPAIEPYAGVIVPRFWDETRHLRPVVRLLAVFLVTGRPALDIPGLFVAGPQRIAEDAGIEVDEVIVGLSDLEQVGFVQVDRAVRIIRVPRAPRYGQRANHKILYVWWRRWRLVPASPLKVDHIASLREALADDPKPGTIAAWNETFGTLGATIPPTVGGTVPGSSASQLTLPATVAPTVSVLSPESPDPDRSWRTPPAGPELATTLPCSDCGSEVVVCSDPSELPFTMLRMAREHEVARCAPCREKGSAS